MIVFLKKIFPFLLIWIPFGIWALFILFDTWIVKIHEVFYLAAAAVPFASLILFFYGGTIFAIYRSKKYKLLFILFITLSFFKYLDHWVSFGSKASHTEIELKVVTWNVERLGALKKENDIDNLIKLSKFLMSLNPDVAIIQEISEKQVKRLTEELGVANDNYKWSSYYNGSWGGLAVIVLNNSDWKLKQKKAVSLPPNWQYIFTEISNNSGRNINVLGIHIIPPQLTEEELLKSSKEMISGNTSRLKKLLKNYVSRARLQNSQIEKLNAVIKQFNDPTVIAGDFNSPAQLPIHSALRKQLNDAWLNGGNGLGATRYWGGILPFRIDYIYTTKDIKTNKTSTHNQNFSDHRPVSATLYLNK